jgi:prephenate dehydrogenase/chorismate mutase
MVTPLDSVRKQIDEVDNQIVLLLEKRVNLAIEVACIKRESINSPLTDNHREVIVIQKLQSLISDPILKDSIGDIYQKLFSLSKNVRFMSQAPVCPFKTIGIIGNGLIGHSLFKIISGKSGDEVKVHIHGREWNISQYQDCELIIIATPIDNIESVARTLASSAATLKRNAIVIDVASTKEHIAKTFLELNEELGGQIHFVPTHPMGGRQEQGSDAAQMTLFAGRPWIVCPSKQGESDVNMMRLISFIKYCGSHVIFLDPIKHDHLVSYVSHMPGLLSKALSDFVTVQSSDSLVLAGSGFELMTKIGKTENIRMRSQISKHNELNIQHAMDQFIVFLKKGGIEWK